MANKSVGQWVGTIVGAVIGFFIPGSYVALGAALGGAIGGAIDPPKGPKIVGPRLSDLSVQTASYGSAIPRVYGTIALYGTVVWIENNQLREQEKTEEQGGKGGGGQEVTTYSYSVTCAILLCKGPIVGVKRIWAGTKLIYDSGATDVEGILASNMAVGMLFSHKSSGSSAEQTTRNGPITIYTGGESQTANPRMQMTLGSGNVSGFRGYAYAVLEDFQLEDYGNSMLGCPFKFEIMTAATYDDYQQLSYHPDVVFPRWTPAEGPFKGRIEAGVLKVDYGGYTHTISANGELLDYQPSDFGTLTFGHVGMLGNSVVEYTVGYTGWLKVSGVNFMYRSGATPAAGVWEFMGANVNQFGTRLYVCAYRDGQNYFNIYDEDLNLLSSTVQTFRPFPITNIAYPSLPGSVENFTVEEGGGFLWNATVYSGTVDVFPISADGTVGSLLHEFDGTTPFMGSYGNKLCVAASDGLCWGATNGGGMFIFSRGGIATPSTVALSDIIESECMATGYLSSGDLDTSTITDQVRGYRVSNNAAVRSALEALQAPYPFDVIQDGYKVKFVRRGGSSVATIIDADLATVSGSKSDEPKITVSREMDAQLPRRIEVSYFDATREYDTGEQAAERTSNTGTALVRIEVPIVMTPDEGAQCADLLLYLYHIERLEIAVSLPMRDPYSKLQPADPVTLVTPEATYFVRVTSITQESDHVIKLTARLADVALYSPTAKGEAASVVSRPIEFTGPSILTILDIPVVSSANEGPGVVLAARGAYSGWRGGNVLRSDDGGVGWVSQAWMTAPGATVALATNAIGAAPTNAMDVTSILNVKMSSGDISSVSELALFNGANHFAYGEPGRWEIIGARTVTLQGDGSYNLTNLLRGRYGSEWAMASHAALDDVVLLTSSTLNFAAQPTSSIGSPRNWTILGYGDADVAQNDRQFTYAGENLECLSPVFVRAFQAASGDWTILWVRRTRIDGEWRDYVDAGLGEAAENYAVEIYSSGTYATLKRTITATTQSATYTNAQQVTDFGIATRALYYRVSQVSALVGSGRNNNYLDTSPLSVALMNFEQSPPIEIYGRAITLSGSAARSAVQARFGSYSLVGNGPSGYAQMANLNLGPGNWTIEFSVYCTALPSSGYSVPLLQLGTSTTNGGINGFLIILDWGGSIDFQYQDNLGAAGSGVINGWQNIAVMCNGTHVRVRLEGAAVGTYYERNLGGLTSYDAVNVLRIGGGTRSSGEAQTVYVDNLRILQSIPYWSIALPTPTEYTY